MSTENSKQEKEEENKAVELEVEEEQQDNQVKDNYTCAPAASIDSHATWASHGHLCIESPAFGWRTMYQEDIGWVIHTA